MLAGGEDFTRVTVQRIPSLEVFNVSAVLLETECPIVALEDIDAIVASRTVERRYDQVRHGEMLYGYKSFHLMSAARATGTPKMSRKIGSSSVTE